MPAIVVRITCILCIKANCTNENKVLISSLEVLGKSDKFCRKKCKKNKRTELAFQLSFFFLSLSFSLLSSLIGAPGIFLYRPVCFLPWAQIYPSLVLFFFFHISFSFFWFLRIFFVVLFGRAKECAALGLIIPSKGTGGELRLRNSLWPDFRNSWPRKTRRDLPSDLDCFWITDISND